ncbi:MAG: DUF3597 domain-containing protein [Erythrobacter sp.]|nr:DUF3597 domain-containing protein [Erythrobacter sp.]
MGMFSSIKDAIFGKDEPKRPDPRPTTASPKPGMATRPQSTPRTGTVQAGATKTQRETIDTIDVENHLDSMPGADRLNWRTSIVDLLKLINVDSDYASRKALASELGREDYEGSAEDNVWLHKRTMRELAAHGGKVPPEYLD